MSLRPIAPSRKHFILGGLAYWYMQKENYVAAREVLLLALQQRNDIRDITVLNKLLDLLWWTWAYPEEHRESIEFFSTYLQSHPNEAHAYHLRAVSLWYSGELQQAIKDYSKALELDSKDIVAHMGRGRVFAESGEFSDALADLDFVHDNLENVDRGDASWKTQIQLLFQW